MDDKLNIKLENAEFDKQGITELHQQDLPRDGQTLLYHLQGIATASSIAIDASRIGGALQRIFRALRRIFQIIR